MRFIMLTYILTVQGWVGRKALLSLRGVPNKARQTVRLSRHAGTQLHSNDWLPASAHTSSTESDSTLAVKCVSCPDC